MLPTGTKWNNVRDEAGVDHDHARSRPSTMDLATLQSRGVLRVSLNRGERGEGGGEHDTCAHERVFGVFSSNFPTYR